MSSPTSHLNCGQLDCDQCQYFVMEEASSDGKMEADSSLDSVSEPEVGDESCDEDYWHLCNKCVNSPHFP